MSKERLLWLQVIVRAQEDARGNFVAYDLREENTRMLTYLAKKWLMRESKALAEVCEMAGVGEAGMERILRDANCG